MFDWTKGNIVNKVVFSGANAYAKGDSIAVDTGLKNPRTDEEVNRIIFKRQGEYFNDRVIDSKVFRTAGYEGQNAKLTIDCSDIKVPNSEAPFLFQATLKIKMFNKFLGEYANANWALFGKPILAGFAVKPTVTTSTEGEETVSLDAADFAAALYEALCLAVPENNRFMEISYADSTKLEITLPDCYADFESFAVESYDPTACDSCLGEYHRVLFADGKITIEHNVEPFATGEWIRENLRFPSYPNMRYAPLYADEQPVPGAKYVMYAFRYRVEGLPAGLNWAGERATSETQHIFYVLESADAKFQEALKAFDDKIEIVDDHFHKDENEEPMHDNPSTL